jgi:ABC-type phosphate transport system substrate-binding protein
MMATSPSARIAAALLALLLVVLGGGGAPARAATCDSLSNPVYVSGSTAAKPLLAEIGRYFSSQTPAVTIVYLGQGSCGGIDAILNGTPLRGEGQSGLSYWEATGAERHCDVPLSGPGVQADVGMSDVFTSTCVRLPGGLPTNVADFLGPVQTMTFVVPKASPERSISAEAAYNVYGFGADSGVDPWTDESIIYRRDDSSGTQRMIATAIGVDPSRWKGTATTSSDDLTSRLGGAGPGAIGILSTDVAQDARDTLNVLAYQHTGQTCGYYPDRDAKANDKINVRDGHYQIWGPLHMLTRLNGNGYPIKPAAADVIGYMTGTKSEPPGLDLIALEATRHVVPPCAMRVKRAEEMGPLASYAPAGACGCYYEEVAVGVSSCTPCESKAECPDTAPVCSYGYCESN